MDEKKIEIALEFLKDAGDAFSESEGIDNNLKQENPFYIIAEIIHELKIQVPSRNQILMEKEEYLRLKSIEKDYNWRTKASNVQILKKRYISKETVKELFDNICILINDELSEDDNGCGIWWYQLSDYKTPDYLIKKIEELFKDATNKV